MHHDDLNSKRRGIRWCLKSAKCTICSFLNAVAFNSIKRNASVCLRGDCAWRSASRCPSRDTLFLLFLLCVVWGQLWLSGVLSDMVILKSSTALIWSSSREKKKKKKRTIFQIAFPPSHPFFLVLTPSIPSGGLFSSVAHLHRYEAAVKCSALRLLHDRFIRLHNTQHINIYIYICRQMQTVK